MQITSKVVKLTADTGKWLTRYVDTQDITSFSACKQVTTLVTQQKNWREITDDEYQSYMERYEIAIAEDNNDL